MATIYQRGAVWRAGIRRKGVPSITRSFDTQAEAETWAAAEERRLDSGVTVAEIIATPAATTWADLFDRYATEVTPLRRGWQAEGVRLRVFSRTPVFRKALAILTAQDIDKWKNDRLKGVSPSTVGRELATMSAVANYAKKTWRNFPGPNPFTDVEWPKPAKPRKRRVSAAEQETIAAAMGWDGVSTPQTRRQMAAWCHAFAVATMMRAGEIMSITWGDVHSRWVHLPITKNKDSRNVPLSTTALRLLALLTRGADTHRLFPLMTSRALAKYFARATAKAGVVDMHFHDSRREAISRAAKLVANVMDLSKMSGHRNLKVLLDTYYAPEPEYLADLLG